MTRRSHPNDDESGTAPDIPDDIGNRIEPKTPLKGTLTLKKRRGARTSSRHPNRLTTSVNKSASSRPPSPRKTVKTKAKRTLIDGKPDRRSRAKKRASPIQPASPLRAEWVMSLNTRTAVRSYQGRKRKAGKRALPSFADYITYLNLIWERALKDDPWADWYLLRAEESILASRDKLVRMKNQLVQLLVPSYGVELINLGEPATPFVFPLAFEPPQGFQVAELIGLLDLVTQSILAARQAGRIDFRTAEQWQYQGLRAIRATYNAVYGYKNCGVNRKMVTTKTPQSFQAIEMMGMVPDDIVTRARTPLMKPGARGTHWFRKSKAAIKAEKLLAVQE